MATPTTDIRSEIRKADDAVEQTFGRGDAAGMADLYTNDGMLLPTGSDFVRGKEAIQDFWQGAMDMGIKEAKLDILEVERHGDAATEVGRYKLSGLQSRRGWYWRIRRYCPLTAFGRKWALNAHTV